LLCYVFTVVVVDIVCFCCVDCDDDVVIVALIMLCFKC
jgi:hypothetical protein